MDFFFLFQSLLEGITALSDPARQHPSTIDIDQHWSNLLSLSVTDFDVSCLLNISLQTVIQIS